MRPPAVPLVTSDPYHSIWAGADKLTDDVTRHWTHSPQALDSLIRIDGKAYRLMGVDPKSVPAFPQTSLKVTPTRSIYEFANEQVRVTLTFLTPAISNDMDLISRPLTYLTWDVKSLDGKEHEISIYDSTSSELAVYRQDQKVVGSQPRIAGLSVLQIGTADQPVLQKRGDNMRIDWGYIYTAAVWARRALWATATRAWRRSFRIRQAADQR